MEEIKHVKPKTSWKSVKIPQELFSKDEAIDVISLEELTDYEIITSSAKKDSKLSGQEGDGKKQTAKIKARQKKKKPSHESTDTEKGAKRTMGKKERAVSSDVIEDLNASLEAEVNAGKDETSHVKAKKRKREKEKQGKTKSKKRKKSVSDDTVDGSEVVTGKEATTEEELVQSTKGMEAWNNLFVPEPVLRALKEQGFTGPTPIQARVLPSAIRDRMDILGAAETGSGKTLAFGIPLLHYILKQKTAGDSQSDEEPAPDSDSELSEVVTTCSEVETPADDGTVNEDELVEMSDDEDEGNGSSSEEEILEEVEEGGIGCVSVIKDVDFSWMDEAATEPSAVISSSNVKRHPTALILEPTRELAIQVKNHLIAAAKYTDIKVAVIVGGMSIQKQQRVLKQRPDIIVATPGRLWELIQDGVEYLSEVEKTGLLVVDEADRMIEKGHFEELTNLLRKMNRDAKLRDRRHTYVFSATLTLLHSGPQRMMKKKKKVKLDENAKLELLMKNIGLKPKPKIVDLTRKVGTAETLTEARINCSKEEKDVYLYYFLKQYPGRTLLFANSKDCIRRLVSIFTLLKCCPLPLHADMHQKQRLKNLDRFTGNPRGFLVASDVAARGLDIPNIQHVIHYQVPRTVENYVHRSGRTARALKQGLSVMLIGPEDMKDYRKIIHTLNKGEDLPMFPVEQNYLSEVRNRVNMVRQIETQEYRFQRSKRQNDWFKKAAEEIGVDIDEDDGLLTDLGDDNEQMQHSRYIKQMKAELDILLKQPILPRSVGGKYPTQSGKLPSLTQPDSEKDAILHVKKDKKVQDKMLKKDRARVRPVKPVKKKKDKWKKKKQKADTSKSEFV